MTDPVRFGLVGTGHWAATVHAPALAARTDGALVGVWGRDSQKAATLAARHGARGVPTSDELFATCDVVSFAVPPDVQAPLAVAAARAGCHLLLEKPVALDPAAATEVAAAVDEAGVGTVVFFTARFDPRVGAWLDGAAAAGPWLGGRATWFGANAEPGSPYRASAWRRQHGGPWDVGPHSLAVLLPLLGPVDGIVALAGPGDIVHVVTRHATGASATLSVGLTLPPSATRVEAAVYGEAGWSHMPAVEPDPRAAHATAVDELLATVAARVPHACGVALGREVVDVLARATDLLR